MKTAKKPAPPAKKKPIVTVQKMLELSALEPSPLNPRKTMGDISDVRDSMASVGLAQPILVRPHPRKRGRFEIVCGHRRFAAAKALKWKEIACAVRELTDREAIEVMLVENTARADVPPLEEAEAYAALHAPPHSLPVEEIAARVAKSTAHVYQRIRLAEKLCSDGKKALADGRMRLGAALVVIRLEDQKEQKEALQSMRMHKDSPAEARDAQWVVGRRLRVIGEAPFDAGDATLVPAAGACAACPKRSDKQSMLFVDDDSHEAKKARCMDGGCWAKKEEAHQARVIAKAKEDGAEVLKGEKAKKVLPYGPRSSPARGWVRLDSTNPGGRATWGDVLKKAPVKSTVAVVEGQVVELVQEKDARAAARAAGLGWAQSQKGASGPVMDEKEKEKERKRREKYKLEAATWDRTLRELCAGIAANPEPMLKIVIGMCVDAASGNAYAGLDPAIRRGFTHEEIKQRSRKCVDAAAKFTSKWSQAPERTLGDLVAYLFDIYTQELGAKELEKIEKLAGVNLAGVEERAAADLAAAAEKAREARAAKKGGKATKKKGLQALIPDQRAATEDENRDASGIDDFLEEVDEEDEALDEEDEALDEAAE